MKLTKQDIWSKAPEWAIGARLIFVENSSMTDDGGRGEKWKIDGGRIAPPTYGGWIDRPRPKKRPLAHAELLSQLKTLKVLGDDAQGWHFETDGLREALSRAGFPTEVEK